MKRFLDPDNRLNRFLTRVFDCGVLSVLWFLCSIPIFTMGASTIAVYTVTLKMVKNEEGAIAKSFFQAFRANFRQSIFVTVIGIIVYVSLFLDYTIVKSSGMGRSGLLVACLYAAFILFTGVYVYVCPLLAKFDNTIKNTFVNAWKLAVLNPIETIMFIVLSAGPIIYFVMRPDHFLIVLPEWLLLGPGGLSYIMSVYFRKIFDKLIPEE